MQSSQSSPSRSVGVESVPSRSPRPGVTLATTLRHGYGMVGCLAGVGKIASLCPGRDSNSHGSCLPWDFKLAHGVTHLQPPNANALLISAHRISNPKGEGPARNARIDGSQRASSPDTGALATVALAYSQFNTTYTAAPFSFDSAAASLRASRISSGLAPASTSTAPSLSSEAEPPDAQVTLMCIGV